MAATTGHALAQGIMEFSKRMVTGVLILFALQVLLSVVSIWVDGEAAANVIELMRVCIPFYITGVAGYSAKAGVENALKIMNDAKQLTEEKKEGNE